MKVDTEKMPVLSKTVYDAIQCFISSKYLDTAEIIDQRWHNAYTDECRLYGELFKQMTSEEGELYHNFVVWLDSSGLYNCDLTVNHLFRVFVNKFNKA